jgi:hypothetical protein
MLKTYNPGGVESQVFFRFFLKKEDFMSTSFDDFSKGVSLSP